MDTFFQDWTKIIQDADTLYKIKRTRNGTTRYSYGDKFVKAKDVPKDIKNRLEYKLHGWSSGYIEKLTDDEILNLNQEICERVEQNAYSFESYESSVQYYKNNVRIPKRCIPPWIFEKLRPRTSAWDDAFKEYTNKMNDWKERQKANEETYREYVNERKAEEGMPKDYNISIYLNARNLLNFNGIVDRKTWKKWMLINHPDKTKDVDIELVQLINGPIDLVYPV